MNISSPAFQANERIPDEYTCQGENINPPLTISGAPEETQSLALIVEDPDAPAGTFDHWLVFNIDSTVTEIGPGSIPPNGIQVVNGFGQLEYGGPCPPAGPDHRYFFKIYALGAMLDPNLITDKPSLLAAMQGHTLASAELIGLYSR